MVIAAASITRAVGLAPRRRASRRRRPLSPSSPREERFRSAAARSSGCRDRARRNGPGAVRVRIAGRIGSRCPRSRASRGFDMRSRRSRQHDAAAALARALEQTLEISAAGTGRGSLRASAAVRAGGRSARSFGDSSSPRLGVARGGAGRARCACCPPSRYGEVAARFHAPLVHFPLEAAHTRRDPTWRAAGFPDFAAQEIEDRAPRRHRVGMPITNCTCGGSLSSPSHQVAALYSIARSNTSISGFTSFSSIVFARLSMKSGGFS